MPRYGDLLERDDAPPGSSWGLFGRDDQHGTLNFITPYAVRRAAALVKRGETFGLDCLINTIDPPLAHRGNTEHVMVRKGPLVWDDYLDGFWPQGGSQIDGLRHIQHPEHGFYNGTRAEALSAGSPALSVHHWAMDGIVGRGVLLDVERYLRGRGRPLDPRSNEGITVGILDEVAAEEGVSLEPGDVLLVRTGWLRFYLDAGAEDRRRLAEAGAVCPGLIQAAETVEWLWDHRVACAAADNPSLEALPPHDSSPFPPGHNGMRLLHPDLIALLGFVVGELWALDELAEACAADGAYEFMVAMKPLPLVGGVGSPANAIAIK